MDIKLYEQAIKDAQEHLQTTPNAQARSLLVKKIVAWRKLIALLRNITGGQDFF